MKDYKLISTADELAAMCTLLSNAEWIALDTEFMREKTYYPEFCLLQLASESGLFCVDPLALEDLSPLKTVLLNPQCLKIMHAGRQDMELFFHLWQAVPAPVFDTQIAAMLAGLGDQMGYAALVQRLTQVSLHKAHSRADWKRRPLSQDELEYAMDDVRYLYPVYQKLQDKLQQLERSEWIQPEMDLLTDENLYRPDLENLWQKTARRQKLNGASLLLLKKLAAWREQRAQHSNRPRKWIMKDDLMLDMAKRMPCDKSQLSRLRGMDQGLLNKQGDMLLQLVNDSLQADQSEWPISNAPKKLTAEQDAQLDLLMTAVRMLAQKHDLVPAMLSNRADMQAVVRGEALQQVFSGWRYALLDTAISPLLAGTGALCIQQGRVQLLSINE